MEKLIEEMIKFQQEKLLQTGKMVIPHLTYEDLLQPNDFPELEHNAHFRYEEGILAGILSVQSAFLAQKKEEEQVKNTNSDLSFFL